MFKLLRRQSTYQVSWFRFFFTLSWAVNTKMIAFAKNQHSGQQYSQISFIGLFHFPVKPKEG